MVKSGLAAGLSWWIAGLVTGVSGPALAPLTALVVVQVSVRASVRLALQRSAAVVLGVLLALAIGDALTLNGFTVGVLAALSLGVTELVFRLPAAAARQVPVSVLVVLTAVTSSPITYGWLRAVDTVIGAAVGVAVSLVLPASRLVDARQTLDRLGSAVGGVLASMGAGLQQPWSTDQTAEWRRLARTARDPLVRQAIEAVGNGREAARWNVRDRRHINVLGRYEDAMPAPGADRHRRLGHLAGPRRSRSPRRHDPPGHARHGCPAGRVGQRRPLGGAGRARRARATPTSRRARRGPRADGSACAQACVRRARLALEHDEAFAADELEGEWLGYAALLVQVDRIVVDLSAPVPT